MNLLFSAFLVTAFMVCASFFTGMIHDSFAQNFTAHTLLLSLIFLLFGLLLFYATRVGDGKAVKRFSPLTLIVLVLPTLYIIIASIATFMPLHDVFVENNSFTIVPYLASVAFGYGIPYTFFSGFEQEAEEAADVDEEAKILVGGVEQDILSENENSDSLDDENDIMEDYEEET